MFDITTIPSAIEHGDDEALVKFETEELQIILETPLLRRCAAY